MVMENVSTPNLKEVAFGQVDDILVNAEGSTRRITKSNFLGAMNDWATITNKPFDTFNNTYFRTTERSDGADILTLSDSVIAYFDKTDTLQTDFAELDTKVDENYASLNAQITNSINSVASYFGGQLGGVASRVTTLEGNSHTHDNKAVIDLFTTSDSKLLWNGTAVGSDYVLPIATSSVLGGVKPDGTTITVDSDGTIHGASQGLDFNALSTSMTTGTQSGITVTADTENSRFNFEVTGIPTIAIDAEGYWIVNGERGENPTKAQGVDGESGYSPTAKVVPTENGATITIIDKNGETNATISNGTAGISPHINAVTGHWFIGETDTGVLAEGTNGRGITSVDKTSSVDNVDTYTITYSDTTTSNFDITNGITTVSTDKIDYTCVFKATDWSSSAPYTQTVNVAGITEAINPRIDIIVSDGVSLGIKEEAAFACVTRGITGDGMLTLYCYEEKPTVDMNIIIEVV